jgi:hypothetical protein
MDKAIIYGLALVWIVWIGVTQLWATDPRSVMAPTTTLPAIEATVTTTSDPSTTTTLDLLNLERT